MKKVLIIGANGFVGRHLATELRRNEYECIGADIKKNEENNYFDDFFYINILEEKCIYDLLKKVRPEYIINLAAVSSVKYSWDMPALTFDVNVKGSINILEAVRKLDLNARILFIGSSEEYGKIDYSIPVNEEMELMSINPYGISKISQEKIVRMYSTAYDLDTILVRSFNHIGRGQGKGFVVPDLASQLIEIERGISDSKLFVGNLSAERDFTDVRDVVYAYRLLLEKGKSGEVYNIGSGEAISIQKILDMMIEILNIEVSIIKDKEKFRAIDTPRIVCDNTKIRKDTQWRPKYELKESLASIIDYWREIK